MSEPTSDRPTEQLGDWEQGPDSGEQSPQEQFRQISHIAQLMSHDLLDKMRWWERDTLEKPDEEVEKRLDHMRAFLQEFQSAYVKFSEVDF